MINHITLLVTDFSKSKKFFAQALRPLGYSLLADDSDRFSQPAAGFGTTDTEGSRDFWIREDAPQGDAPSFSCLAFTASSKSQVDEFHQAALSAGGRNNGAPGYREKYHPGYYAAFVIDPDGRNIEAVYDDPSQT